MAKMTFSLDDETVRTLRMLADRKQKPQSVVVREAIVEHAAKDEKLSDAERARKLHPPPSGRSLQRAARKVDAELGEIRRSRRAGWSRRSD